MSIVKQIFSNFGRDMNDSHTAEVVDIVIVRVRKDELKFAAWLNLGFVSHYRFVYCPMLGQILFELEMDCFKF